MNKEQIKADIDKDIKSLFQTITTTYKERKTRIELFNFLCAVFGNAAEMEQGEIDKGNKVSTR